MKKLHLTVLLAMVVFITAIITLFTISLAHAELGLRGNYGNSYGSFIQLDALPLFKKAVIIGDKGEKITITQVPPMKLPAICSAKIDFGKGRVIILEGDGPTSCRNPIETYRGNTFIVI